MIALRGPRMLYSAFFVPNMNNHIREGGEMAEGALWTVSGDVAPSPFLCALAGIKAFYSHGVVNEDSAE